LQDYARHLGRVVARMPAAKERGLLKAGHVVAERAKSKLGTYQAGWPPLKPETIARKATGDSPLLETGAMRNTIAEHASPAKATITVGGPALWQELGTSKMPPRPFMGPALRESAGEIEAAIGGEIAENLRSR
jgi:HK97 gp10 family phage protein